MIESDFKMLNSIEIEANLSVIEQMLDGNSQVFLPPWATRETLSSLREKLVLLLGDGSDYRLVEVRDEGHE